MKVKKTKPRDKNLRWKIPAIQVADSIAFPPSMLQGYISFYIGTNLVKGDRKTPYSAEELQRMEDISDCLIHCSICNHLKKVRDGKVYLFRRWKNIPSSILALGINIQFICQECLAVKKKLNLKVNSPTPRDLAHVIGFTAKEGEGEAEPEPGSPQTVPVEVDKLLDEPQQLTQKEESTQGSETHGTEQTPGNPENLVREKRDTPGNSGQESRTDNGPPSGDPRPASEPGNSPSTG